MTKLTPQKRRQWIIALIGGVVMFTLLFLDQITKAVAAVYARGGRTTFIPGFIYFSYLENDGIAFSLFGGNSSAMTFLTVLTAFLIVGIAVLFFVGFKRNTPVKMALAVVEAGAIGNLIDRLFLTNAAGDHIVRDFIDVSSVGFGTCNLADFYVTFGGVALFLIILFIGKDAIIPITKKWREQAKREEENAEKNKSAKKDGFVSAADSESIRPDGSQTESKTDFDQDES